MSGLGTAGLRPFKDWTKEAGKRIIKSAPLPPLPRWNIKKGDLVAINTGRASGSQGRVKAVLKKSHRVVVEGANMIKNFVRPTPTTPGGIIPKESPVHYSNVNLIDPSTGWPTKVKTRLNSAGVRERVSAKTGVVIPFPEGYGKPRPYFVVPSKPSGKDTAGEVVRRVTYQPPPALAPYLAASSALYAHRGGKGEAPAVPSLLRNKLPRKVRRRMRGEWEKRVEKDLVASMVMPPLRVFQERLAGVEGLEGGSGGVAPQQQQQQQELR